MHVPPRRSVAWLKICMWPSWLNRLMPSGAGLLKGCCAITPSELPGRSTWNRAASRLRPAGLPPGKATASSPASRRPSRKCWPRACRLSICTAVSMRPSFRMWQGTIASSAGWSSIISGNGASVRLPFTPGPTGYPAYDQERQADFCELAKTAGRPCSVFTSLGIGTSIYDWEKEQHRHVAWLRSLPKPVGVFLFNDIPAHRVLDLCRDAGVQVPDRGCGRHRGQRPNPV